MKVNLEVTGSDLGYPSSFSTHIQVVPIGEEDDDQTRQVLAGLEERMKPYKKSWPDTSIKSGADLVETTVSDLKAFASQEFGIDLKQADIRICT